ncbi:MAG: FAD-binding protein, partial [Ignavibacteriales bacterium]
MNIEQNKSLKEFTTFKIGGPAEYFANVKNVEDLQEALKWAKDNKQSFRILGGGSNMLVSDQGLKGLVIKLNFNKLEFNDNKVIVEPGVMLSYLLNKSLENGLTGMEFAAGVPGTVGGAIRGNAGTYGLAMDSVVKKIK